MKFKRGDQVELGAALLGSLIGAKGKISDLVYDEGSLYHYRTGVYRCVEPNEKHCILQGFAGVGVIAKGGKPLLINDMCIRGAIRCAHARVESPTFFDGAEVGLAFQDVFLQVAPTGVKRVKHSPNHRARFAYPFKASVGKRPTLFFEMLKRVFGEDEDGLQKIECIREMVGASLIGVATRFQRALVLVGAGGEGKSTLLRILSACFPPEACSSIAPQLWSQEYRRAMLAGKRGNFVAELPSADIVSSENFKAIISGERIDGRTIRESPFEFRPTAGHIFGANALPNTHDQSVGFWRRLIVIRLDKQIAGTDRDNPDVANPILAEEIPAIVAWLVEGAANVLRRGAYQLPDSHCSELRQWQVDSDQLAQFLNEYCRPIRRGETGTRAASFYLQYSNWAISTGHKPLSLTNVGVRIREKIRILLRDFRGDNRGDSLLWSIKRGKGGITYPYVFLTESEKTSQSVGAN